jgi:hypothetical protein
MAFNSLSSLVQEKLGYLFKNCCVDEVGNSAVIVEGPFKREGVNFVLQLKPLEQNTFNNFHAMPEKKNW